MSLAFGSQNERGWRETLRIQNLTCGRLSSAWAHWNPCALELSFTISASKSFTLTIPKVYLPKPRLAVNGPQGVQATFAWQAAYDSTLQAMCSAVLVNDVSNYNNGTVA